jgi:GNAT superfamily N-acetyltransferase
MSGIRIRQATLRDLDTLVRHRRRMFEEMQPFSEEEHAIGDREYRRWARRLMSRGELVAWVAETASGTPVAGGAVWLQERQPRPGKRAAKAPYLLSMYTEREFRGRGLASRIVREAMAWSRRNGYAFMTLHASAQGRSVYKKLQWERTWEMRVLLKKMKRST